MFLRPTTLKLAMSNLTKFCQEKLMRLDLKFLSYKKFKKWFRRQAIICSTIFFLFFTFPGVSRPYCAFTHQHNIIFNDNAVVNVLYQNVLQFCLLKTDKQKKCLQFWRIWLYHEVFVHAYLWGLITVNHIFRHTNGKPLSKHFWSLPKNFIVEKIIPLFFNYKYIIKLTFTWNY